MPCHDCINRRDFLTAAGAAGLVAISGCGDGIVTGPVIVATLPSGPIVVAVASLPDLATVGRLVRIPNTSVAVKRLDASTFDALSMVCTHQGCLVTITNGAQFDCPCHASRFANDGAVVRGPAQQPLPHFTTSYDPATDQLTVT